MTNADEQASKRITPTARLVVALSRAGTGRGACRVEAPARVLRMWAVLNAADDELHQAALTPPVLARLQRSLQVIRTELEHSVSAPLANELGNLLPPQPAPASIDDLRIECASLLGWTGGLAVGILEQVEAAAASALPGEAGIQPENSLPATTPAA